MIERKKILKIQLNILFWNRTLALLNSLVHLGFLLLTILLFIPSLNIEKKLNWDETTSSNLKILLITLATIMLLFSSSLNFIVWSNPKNNLLVANSQLIILCWMSLNFGLVIINTWFVIHEKTQKRTIKFLTKESWRKRLGFYRWSIFEITLVSIFSSLVVLGNWMEMTIHFLPYGAGGVNIKYLFVMIIALLHSFASGLAVGFIGSLISLLFLGANLILSPWSCLLDYVLPTISPAIVAFFPHPMREEKKKIRWLNYLLMVGASSFLVWFWQTLSGYLFWTKLLAPTWGKAGNGLVYSLVFNGISIWTFSYPPTQILLPIIIRRLSRLSWKR